MRSNLWKKIEPGDVPHEIAARRLGLTLDQFKEKRPALERRGFPLPDATTDFYDLDAIEAWRRHRNPRLFGLSASTSAIDACTSMINDRLASWAGADG